MHSCFPAENSTWRLTLPVDVLSINEKRLLQKEYARIDWARPADKPDAVLRNRKRELH